MAQKASTMYDSTEYSYVFKGSWFSLTRPMTLTGTISPVVAGTIYAIYENKIDILLFIGFIFASLLIQSAVNMFNDYFDFRNGQDKDKWEAVSGPVPFYRPSFKAIKHMAFLLLLLAMGIGLWLVFQSNIWVLAIGISGIVCGVYYSFGRHSFSALGLGEIIAAIFLGIVPANLGFMIQGLGFDLDVFLVSLLFSLLISSMILTNNIRDLLKDTGFRKTIAIRLGRKKSLCLLLGILSSLYLITCLLVAFDITPWQTILALSASPFALYLYQSLITGDNQKMGFSCMKWAAWHHWAFSVIFILGLSTSL